MIGVGRRNAARGDHQLAAARAGDEVGREGEYTSTIPESGFGVIFTP